MFLGEKRYTMDRVVRLALAAGLFWAIIQSMRYLSDVLIPFVAALIIAYLMNPLVAFVQRWVRSRPVAVGVSFVVVLCFCSVLLLTVAPLVSSEVRHMGRLVADFANNSNIAERAVDRMPPQVWEIVRDIVKHEELQSFFVSDRFLDIAQQAARKLLPGLWGAFKGARDILLGVAGLAIILLYTVFLLMDFSKVSSRWHEILPPSWREPVTLFADDFMAGMNRYFRAQALVASLVGVLFSVGFSLIGLPMAIVLGMFIGLLNMVPYLQIIGFIPALLLGTMHSLETGMSLLAVYGLVVAVFATVQILQDGVLVPKIMGQAMGLSPWMILLSLSVWGKLLGLLGLLIALPMTVLCLSYYRRMISGWEAEQGAEAE